MITVQYACMECGIKDRNVIVPERGEEDVVSYVRDIVADCVGADHRLVSPKCKAPKMTYLKIPFDGNDPEARVGAKRP